MLDLLIENRRVLSLEDVRSMSPSEIAKHLSAGTIFPIAGAEDPPPGSSEEEKAAKEKEEQERKDAEEKARKEAEEKEEEEKEEEEKEELPRSEVQRLRRIAAESDKAKREADAAKKKAEEKEKKEAGRWEELLKEKDTEIAAANKRADESDEKYNSLIRNQRVEKVAKRLAFKDPADAHLYLDSGDMEDDKLTESALKRVAREKPYLVDKKRSTGAPVGNGNGSGPTLTMEDIKGMSEAEINARWSEVSKVMAAEGKK